MQSRSTRPLLSIWLLLAGFALTTAIYWPGLSGTWLFDDYPNIVANPGVHPAHMDLASLMSAALSSPASEFKRPIASLSFAVNYLFGGLDPYGYKLTNLIIHLLNGLLVFALGRALLRSLPQQGKPAAVSDTDAATINTSLKNNAAGQSLAIDGLVSGESQWAGVVAALIAASWMLLPINLTGVLYVVQRMESIANLFVLIGLIGYVKGRRRLLGYGINSVTGRARASRQRQGGFLLCLLSITVPTALGVMAKETAVMLPFYALLVEWTIFRFAAIDAPGMPASGKVFDCRLMGMFSLTVVVPLIVGLAWLLPGILRPSNWASRDFTLGTRLLSETRIIVDYIVWTVLPTPSALSFYHDDFRISTGLLSPSSTFFSICALAALFVLMLCLRRRKPLVSLGISLFFGCQLLTGTILPLELVYEHRNYFASFGLLLAVVPLLAAPAPDRQVQASEAKETPGADASPSLGHVRNVSMKSAADRAEATSQVGSLPMAMPRYALLAGLMVCWAGLTALSAYAWGNPLRLADDLATRAAMSPRAQYELGRTYIIYSHYDPASPFTRLAYAALEKAAALPGSSILPEQALIFMNARMKLPLKSEWWDSMVTKLMAHKPGVQDESSLDALTQCDREHQCDLPKQRMTQAYLAALSHPNPSARLLAMYGDYAWNVLEDQALGERMTAAAVQANPSEPAYQITLVRMLAAKNQSRDAKQALKRLERLNIGGRLDTTLTQLRTLRALQ
jgi:hypothetical protein